MEFKWFLKWPTINATWFVVNALTMLYHFMTQTLFVQVLFSLFFSFVYDVSHYLMIWFDLFYKRIAERVARKNLQSYSDVVSLIRRRLRFDLLKTTLIALRGFRGSRPNSLGCPIGDLDINLMDWLCFLPIHVGDSKYWHSFQNFLTFKL